MIEDEMMIDEWKICPAGDYWKKILIKKMLSTCVEKRLSSANGSYFQISRSTISEQL